MLKNKQINSIFLEIFELNKHKNLGLFFTAATLAVNNEEHKLLYLKELTQQIKSCKKSMIKIFNSNIVHKIINLRLEVEIYC